MDRLALFDLDNTLLDRQSAFEHWCADFVNEHQLSPSVLSELSSLDRDGTTPRETFFAELKDRFGLAASVDHLLREYHDAYPSYYEAPVDTLHALGELRAGGWKLGVVTNGPPSQLAKLDAARLRPAFDVVCISGIVGVSKPDVGIFDEAARQCGVALSGWMVGDTASTDIEGGRRAGLRTIWITRGRPWTETLLHPDDVATSVPQAIEIILASDGQ